MEGRKGGILPGRFGKAVLVLPVCRIDSNKDRWFIPRFDRKAWQGFGKNSILPRLIKLREIRNESEKAVQAGKRVSDFFNDFASCNRLLGEEKLTTKLFIWLDANNPNAAMQVIRFAKRQLVNDQEYKLAVKYVRPETDFEILRREVSLGC